MSHPTDAQIKAAIEWHLHFIETGEDTAQHSAFQAWLGADVRHQGAWATLVHMHRDWQTAVEPAAAALQEVEALQARPNAYASGRKYLMRQIKRHKGSLASVLVLGLGLGLFLPGHWGQWLLADHRSGVGEVRQVVLPDGSLLTLDSGSAVDVSYRHGRRQVTLLKGAVYAEVAKNQAQPFVVLTAQGQAQALGTAFSVRLRSDQETEVVVAESRVRVCATSADVALTPCLDLAPGERSVLSAAGVRPLDPVSVGQAMAWTEGQLVVQNLPLSALLQQLNQHHRGLIRFDAEGMSQYRISGVFPLNDTMQALKAIQTSVPITIGGYAPYYVTVTVAETVSR